MAKVEHTYGTPQLVKIRGAGGAQATLPTIPVMAGIRFY
jgi:hypothetical protein